MAKVTILCWQAIPSLVEARDGDGNRHKIELSRRFQELIDRVAMRRGMAGTDAYLAQWQKRRAEDRPGSAEAACRAAAEALESQYDAIRREELAKCQAS